MGPPPNPPDLPEWQEDLARAVHRLALSVEQYRALAGRNRYGVDASGVEALAVLHLRGPLTPRQIAAAISLSPPATTELLDRLDQAGYITRAPHPTDRRKVLVIKTPLADDLATQEWSDFATLVGSCLRDVDGPTRHRLIAALTEAGRTLEQANARAPGESAAVRRAR